MSHPYASHTKEQLLKQKQECEKIGMSCPDIDAELKQRDFEESINLIKTDIKKLIEPHWTLVPIFWIALTSLVIGILFYFQPTQPVVQETQRTVPSYNSTINSTPMRQHSVPDLKQEQSISHNKDVQVKP